MIVLGAAFPVHALILVPSVTTSGVAPFGETFDAYTLGDLHGQGLWQGDAHAWRVTDTGCYSGRCITANGFSPSGLSSVKTGQASSSGEWRIRFKINSFNFAPFSGTFVSFGTPNSYDLYALSIMPDKTDSTFSTSLITDTFGNTVVVGLAIGSWHTLVFKWNMDNLANCQFAITVDGGADIPAPPIGSASDCYTQTFPTHVISTLDLAQNTAPNEAIIDDIGDGPIVEGQTTCTSGTPGCNSNVMFLPGAEATNLYASGSLTENHIWPPNSVAGQDVVSLDLTNPASANNVYTKEKDIVGMAYGTTRVYQPFIDQMNSLVSKKTIADWEPVAYDWRLDYNDLLTNGNDINGKIYYRGTNAATSTPYIIQELTRLATSSRTKKVTIIAHSNGGLLAKALLQYLGTTTASQLIDKLILVETPQVGTPKAVAGLLHGYDQALPSALFHPLLSPSDARALAISTPAAYNLLPTDQYFTFTDNPVITFNAQSIPEWVARYGDIHNPGAGIHSTTLLRTFMTDISRGEPNRNDTETPAIANTTLFDNATNVHNSLDAWLAPPGIQLVTIAGWGNETLSNIEYTKTVTGCALNTANGCAVPIYGNQITFNPHVVIDGDGTVVDSSAQWANGTTSTRYWLNLEKYNCQTLLTCIPQTGPLNFFRTTHAFVFKVPQLNTLLSSLITNSTPASNDLITTTRPEYTGDEQRLHFVLHSPLTLGFTDYSGNYSGSTATSTIFNVPGVDYQRIGEVQWLSVPKGLAGKVVMRGTASGSFTLNVESVNWNNTLATTTFAAVSSATSTIATLSVDPLVDPAVQSTLQVDFNGDGIVDRTLQAKQGSTVLPDVVAPEAILSISTSTKDIVVTGIDDVSPTTTVTKTATTTTITDQSGNKTTLFFQKTFTSNLLTFARLTGISYGTTTTALPSSFLYVWDASKTLISQTVVADNTFAIQALYNKSQNKTTILVLKKNVPIQTITVTGLAIIKLTTNKGMVNYSW